MQESCLQIIRELNMARRNQPYLPLYVQDYLTDEKLNMCSAASQGVYIKIMCILHKQSEYGTILLKQKDKQNKSTCLNFANKLVKLLPFSHDVINDALEELVDEGVLSIDGDKMFQKRMVADNSLSEKRAKAGSKGGKKNNFAKAKSQTKTEANSDIENENDIKNGFIENSGEKINFADLENTQWFESILRYLKFKINQDQLQEYWIQFQEGMIADNDLFRDKDDYRAHFRNWVKIQIEKNEKNRTNNRNRFKSDTTECTVNSIQRRIEQKG